NQRRDGDEGLRQDVAGILAEHVEAARPLGGLDTDRDRESARLDYRVADEVGGEEPVIAFDERPVLRLERAVALQRVLVVGIEPAFLHQTERFYQPPAVGDRDVVGRKGLGRRRADRARIVLRYRVRERTGVAG